MVLQEGGDHLSALPCFEDTNVPYLSMDGDKWLSVVLPATVELNDELITDLNRQTELSLGRRAAQEEAIALNLASVVQVCESAKTVARRAAVGFRDLIGAKDFSSPFCQDGFSNVLPLNTVGITRLFAESVSKLPQNLPLIVARAVRGRVYHSRPETIARRIALMRDDGLDAERIITLSIQMLVTSDKDREAFLRDARKVGTNPRNQHYKFLLDKPAPPSSAGLPEVPDEPQPGRYAELAGVTGWTQRYLIDNFPGVEELGPGTFKGLCDGLGAVAEVRRPQVRHVWRLAPELKPKAERSE